MLVDVSSRNPQDLIDIWTCRHVDILYLLVDFGTLSSKLTIQLRFILPRLASVVVSDTGYGIPANELPFIFNRYRRVEGHKGRAVGTGLGLAIVKRIVDGHHGVIRAASTMGQGTEFTISLPTDSANR